MTLLSDGLQAKHTGMAKSRVVALAGDSLRNADLCSFVGSKKSLAVLVGDFRSTFARATAHVNTKKSKHPDVVKYIALVGELNEMIAGLIKKIDDALVDPESCASTLLNNATWLFELTSLCANDFGPEEDGFKTW